MSSLKIIPLGGMGRVTQNMYVYEYDNEILLVDCGIGFPDYQMPGVDVLLPDISYLESALESGKEIVGMILSHGHDDHIAATGYLVPRLGEFPIYASPLTAGFAQNRMRDFNVEREIIMLKDKEQVQVGEYFNFYSIAVTHSVPDTKHLIIKTPEGIIYHGTDFKFDENPVDGIMSDYDAMKEIGNKGVLCALSDCLRVEREEAIPSESTVGPSIKKAMQDAKGKVLVTMMSSHIHRIQQTVDAALELGRKVVFVGRSVEQNVKVALELKKLKLPASSMVNKKKIKQVPDHELCIIIAGSQGQEGSSLVRAVFGEHREIMVNKNDTVIFSADAIPGNEVPYYQSIDELASNEVHIVYPDIAENLHQSGHASAAEQLRLLEYLQPKYVMPIGGADRHRALYVERVAKKAGMEKRNVLLPKSGQVVAFSDSQVSMQEQIILEPQTVDGKGIGDVGKMVLSDRKTLGESGIVVVLVPENLSKLNKNSVQVVSRGFVFMRDADEVIDYIKDRVIEIIRALGKRPKQHLVKKEVEKRLGKSLYKVIQREPIVLTAFT